MKKWVKITAIVLVCLASGAGVAYTALQPLGVEAATVRPQSVTLTFTEQGSYEYTRLYTVYPLVAGEILEVSVREGDRVAAGDVLAVVNASDYQYQIEQLQSAIAGYNGQISNVWLQEQQERASLSATLQNLEGQLVTLEGEIAKNQQNAASLETQIQIQERIVAINAANVSNARKHLREMRDYGEDEAIASARQAVNAAQSTLAQNELLLEQLLAGNVPEDVYEGQRMAIQAQMDGVAAQMSQSYAGGMYQYYNAQIEAAQTSIAQMEERAGQASITAPVSGVLSTLPAGDQNLLTQQSPVATIGSAPCVEVFVPLREVDGLAVGDPVELILDKRLGSETIPGTIQDIEEEALVKLSALGVEERKVRVLITPKGGDLQIGYGMDVRFSPYTFQDVLVVPKTAMFQVEDQWYVWAIREERLERLPVEQGAETRDGYIVDSGLRDGDVVVTDGDNGDLSAGKRVVITQ